MEDICNFIPLEKKRREIEFFHFVYETNLQRFRQPFHHSNYYANLIFKGSATLKIEGHEYALKPGTLFFTYPFQAYEITDPDAITLLYISFNGSGIEELFNKCGIAKTANVFSCPEGLTEFWMNAARRVTSRNATILTESVLLYSLSYIGNDETETTSDADRFEEALAYINTNYTDTSITVIHIADMFFYNEKYFSSLFIKRTGVKFTEYVNRLRIQHAIKLIKSNQTVISTLAEQCGFANAAYFSKVFKRIKQLTPQEYIRQNSTRIS